MGDVRRWMMVGMLAAVGVATVVGTATAADTAVTAQDNVFQPEVVTVTAGDTVTWTNAGAVAHTVTSSADDGASFDRTLQPGDTTTVTFASAGSVDYFCRFHGTAAGTGMAGEVTVQAAQAPGRATARLAGATRIQTAIEISKAAFPDGAGTVYLSSSELNPDALVGGALTAGPILLVPSCGTLPAEVAAEIRRLDPGTVTALGGPRTVCDDILEQAGDA